MRTGVVATAIAPHTPRIGIEDQAPDFQRGLIDGLRAMGDELRGRKPDLFVLLSAHWVSTFNWYVTAHARHEGICIADEAPDLIPGVTYARQGDPAFAQALPERGKAAGLPFGLNASPHYSWDYAAYVPLHYLDPESTMPAVLLPTVICADLAECARVGGLVDAVAREAGQRVVFIASCALSHAIRRGPDLWPPEELQALDRRFIALTTQGKVAELLDWAPTYCREAAAEMEGRPIGGMTGALRAMAGAGGALHGHQYGSYAQSSGSGNTCLCIYADD